MTSSPSVLKKIEELRRQLHQGLGAQYDPVRMQELVPISRELDRLAVEVVRDEMDSRKEKADSQG